MNQITNEKTKDNIRLFSMELVTVFTLFWCSLIVFILITRKIFWKQKEQVDQRVFEYLLKHVNPSNTQWMKYFSYLASKNFLIPANLALIVYFLFTRERWNSIKIPAVALSNTFIMLLLKDVFQRPRPLDPLLEPGRGLSYPSGHSMMAFSFYGLLIFLVWKYVDDPFMKRFLVSVLFLLILTIGLSRIYLRVHYASDVVAGLALGLMCLVLSLWILRKIEKRMGGNQLSAVSHQLNLLQFRE